MEKETLTPETTSAETTPGIEAAKAASSVSGTDAGDVDIVICATSSPDDIFSGTRPSSPEMWGCDSLHNFPFGFATASRSLDKGGGAKNAPVLGAGSVDRMGRLGGRKFLHPFSATERGAEVLTSDGDGSEEGDGVGILGYAMHSNGGGAQGPEMHPMWD